VKALVVYDSVFGNTAEIAQDMAAALGDQARAVKVDAVSPQDLEGVSLLLVGSPTRAFRPTPATSAWLKALPAGSLSGVRVAAFDTRISAKDANSALLRVMVKLFGWAAKPIANGLTKAGGALAADPEGFYVQGAKGPLKDGERERAAAWAQEAALS
jgi:flavodoxin